MRVAVLGAGNGGVASAFDFAQHGHEVSLYAPPEFGENVVAVDKAGGITASGDLAGLRPDPVRRARRRARPWPVPSSWCSWVRRTAPSRWPPWPRPHLTEGMAVLICPGSCAGAIAFKRAAGLELDDERYLVGETSTLPYAVRVTEPGVVNVFLKLTTGVYLAGAAASGDGPAVRARQGRLAGCRDGRQRLPDHAPERQPGDPSGGHAAQRRPARADRRRLPVLRGGCDRERRAADRGGRQRAAGDRRRAGGHDPVRTGPRGQAGIHARGELLDRVQHRAPASWGSQRSASSTTATSPRTSATR